MSANKQPITLRGQNLLRNPLLNKGSAFTLAERKAFGLEGLIPHAVTTMDVQASRVYDQFSRIQDDFDLYIALSSLQDRNEQLFYRLLQMREMLQQIAQTRSISLIVVTDGESILGIGDQGAGGMAISIGKLALYSAGAGIDPACTLPISLDFGTNNPQLQNDEYYLGWPHARLTGEAYDELVSEFVAAVKEVFPGVLLQWEDFRKDNALDLMETYRDKITSFNDDIQGTGAVALSGVMTALRVTGESLENLRIVIAGAGAAGIGISRQLRSAMLSTQSGSEKTKPVIAVADSRGLILEHRILNSSVSMHRPRQTYTSSLLPLNHMC